MLGKDSAEQMETGSAETACALCLETLDHRPRWEVSLNWKEQCAKSICQLLDLELADFLPFFVEADYCQPCYQFVIDLDFLVRSFKNLKQRISTSRQKLSLALLKSFEAWSGSETELELKNKIGNGDNSRNSAQESDHTPDPKGK
jgi:hypothetical protein